MFAHVKITVLSLFCCMTHNLFSQSYLSHSTYKYQNSMAVFKNIVSAVGENRKVPPFEIIPDDGFAKTILMYYPGEQPKILMDEEVYDQCTKLAGDSTNALAALIGHELAHHYRNHDWCSSFAYLMGDNSLSEKIKEANSEQKLKVEAEADYYGGFYSYLAGYSSYEITERVLDGIYTRFKLPEQITGYPTKAERKAIAKSSLEKLKSIIPVFDAGEMLFVIKEYDAAISCFDYLIDKFPSREIYNNAATIRILKAMEYMNGGDFIYSLPVEFDSKTRLKSGNSRGDNLSKEERNVKKLALLNESINILQSSIEHDSSYLNAKINLCCIYLLKNNFDLVIGSINEILENKTGISNYDLSKLLTVRGIAFAMKKENQSAIEDLEQASGLSADSRTKYNLTVFKNQDKNIFDSMIEYLGIFENKDDVSKYGYEKLSNPDNEKIDGIALKDIMFSGGTAIQLPSNPHLNISTNSTAQSTQFGVTFSNQTIRLIKTSTYFKYRSFKGVGIFTTKYTLKSLYGEPGYIISSLQGEYYIYSKSRIAFLLNKDNLVINWFLYNLN